METKAYILQCINFWILRINKSPINLVAKDGFFFTVLKGFYCEIMTLYVCGELDSYKIIFFLLSPGFALALAHFPSASVD